MKQMKKSDNRKSLKKGNWNKIISERPISPVYKEIDNDLARDNLENNIPAADLQDL